MKKNLIARSLGGMATAFYAGVICPALAADYHFGSTSQNFSIQATNFARDVSSDGTFENNSGDTGIYWRGSSGDSTYYHFDLSQLPSSISLGGSVSLNCVVNANWGGSVTGSQINTANAAWSATVGSAAPGFTAISGANNASGNYNTGDTVSWSVPDATLQTYLNNPSFHGLVVSGNSSSTAHFNGPATLTGTVLVGEIRVTGGTDWSSASWDVPAKTLRITGTNTVTGGNVTLDAGTTLSLQDQASLGSGVFAGNLANQGTVAIASSANQSLSGTLSGTGSIQKFGSGTLTLSGANSYSGQTLINSGTLAAASSSALGQGGHNGATMSFIADGATLALQGGVSLDEHFHIWGSGAGGQGALRSISGNNALTNNPVAGCGYALRSNTTVAVEADTLTVSGFYEEAGSWGLIKTGAGKLVLQSEQTYTGGTTVNGGILEVEGINGRGRLNGTLSVGQGASVVVTGDGSGLGYNGQITQLNLNGGSLVSAGLQHVWSISGGIHLTGGTLSSNSGVSSVSAPQLEWGNTAITSHASTTTSMVSGRIHIRRDTNSILRVDVADGSAATDLEISAALTESAPNCGLVKSGAGKLKLSGAVNLTGVLTVNSGTLDLSSATLGAGVRINMLKGASIFAPAAGLPADAVVFLDGEKMKPGSWGAPGSVAAGTALFESAAIAGSTAMQVPDSGLSNRERWKQLEYGIFSHYTFSMGSSINDAANGFNADAYADAVLASGAQYVVWTAWHSNTFPLFPSQTMAKYGVGNYCSEHDAVGAMIDAVKARGLRVFLYTHPYQPITGPQHNNFINDLYAELIDRYGSKLDGLWIDENTLDGTQDSLVDYTRLITTIKERNPDLVTMQNGGQMYTVDMGGPETINSWNFGYSEPVYNYANPGYGPGADDMFRTNIIQAASNFEGGGVHWSIDGVYNGGLVETTRVNAVGRYLTPIASSFYATKPSASFPPPYKNGRQILFSEVDWVATSSMDDSKEFLHVLKPQSGNTLTLPATADGKRFSSATLVCSLAADNGTAQSAVNLPMPMVQTPRGIRLTLPDGISWSGLDTVIQLDVTSKGGSGMVNDTSTSISYSGSSWSYQSHRGAGEYNDDVHTATANGDAVTLTFTGTDIAYIATRAANRGPVDIFIDDVFQTTVDLSTGTPFGSRQTVYSKSGLARGQHTLKCVKNGGSYMDADCFQVTELVNDSDLDVSFPDTLYYGYDVASYGATGGGGSLWQPGGGAWITPQTGSYPATDPPNGDFFEFHFTGTGAVCQLGTGFGSGSFVMYVDGVYHSTLSVGGNLDFTVSGLSNTSHTIKGVTATTNPYGFIAAIRGFQVTRPDMWNHQTARGYGEIGDDVHYTDINPSRFTYNFSGSGVEFITTRDSMARMAWFGVAGEGVNIGARRNGFSLARQTGTSIFSIPNLTPGNYQLSAQHGANMSGLNFSTARLAIDAIRVYKGVSLSSTPLLWGSSGNGGSGTWDVGSTGNWYDGGASTAWHDFGGSDYAAVFGGSSGTVNLGPNVKANRVTFQSAGYTLQDNSLELNGNSPTVTVETGTATVATTLTGSAGLTKAGLGTLSVTGPNVLTGATVVAEGSLKLNGAYASPSFAIASDAVLDINAATALDAGSASFTGTGTLRKTGINQLFWGGNSAVFSLGANALIDVQSGTMIGGSSANENWTNNLSSLNVATGAIFKGVEANVRLDAITGSGTIGTGYSGAGYQNLTIGVSNGSGQFAGSIINTDNNASWSGNLVKQGTGTIELSGNSTYTGTTTVSAGKLLISGSVANTSTVTIAAGAEVEISGTLTASAQIINYGTLVLTGTPQMSATGGITNYGTIINRSKTYALPGNLNNQGSILSVPAAPSGLAATPADGQVRLNWNPVSGATGYTVKQSAFAVGPFMQVASISNNSQVVAGLTNGSTYYFVVSASSGVGEGAHSTTVSATPSGLPAPFVTADIGSVGLAGSASYSADTFTLQGAGSGVYASSDAFRFVYQPASGDCSITARVQSLTNTGVSAKTGVMIRESLAGNARCTGIYCTPSSGIQFIWRSSTGAMVSIGTKQGLTAPYWVRLTRNGNTFRGYYSGNGTSWTQLSTSKSISMATGTYIGIATTSGTPTALSTGGVTNQTAIP